MVQVQGGTWEQKLFLKNQIFRESIHSNFLNEASGTVLEQRRSQLSKFDKIRSYKDESEGDKFDDSELVTVHFRGEESDKRENNRVGTSEGNKASGMSEITWVRQK